MKSPKGVEKEIQCKKMCEKEEYMNKGRKNEGRG